MSETPKLIDGPALCYVVCAECNHRWSAFLPEGVREGTTLECPSCRAHTGEICRWPEA